MSRTFTSILVALSLVAAQTIAVAQEYTAPVVTVSKEKVRYGGKIYYSHIVQERQTLFSISKAYGVTIQEIFDTNPTLNLDKDGLKKNQILLIPVKEGQSDVSEKSDNTWKASSSETKNGAAVKASADEPGTYRNPRIEDYFEHRVNWFEDLGDIAGKYKMSKKAIMNINGMTSEKLKRKQKLKIPYHPEQWENIQTEPASESSETLDLAETEQPKEESGNGIFDDLFLREGNHKAAISLMLPFNSKQKTDELMMDFYSGVLMAAKDLGVSGRDIDLSVFDSGEGYIPETKERFSESCFTIGPVSKTDILKAVNVCQGSGWIVSPLDPKAEALADTIPNIIQAPAPVQAQIQDMINWVESDFKPGDKIILVTQKGATGSSYPASVVEAVKESGLHYSTLSFGVLEGRNVLGSLTEMMSAKGTTRVILSSDSEAFAIEVVRNLYLISNKNHDLALYSTSKIRSFDTIDLQQLHNINLHVSLSYYVDYDSKDVQRFLLQYRALYNAEPTQFSFQGYDLMNCFSELASKYGSKWEKGMGRLDLNGLQADFNFVKTRSGGYVNNAVRRVIYEPDYSIKLER